MVTVKKTTGGRVVVRGIGEFEVGDTADVGEADAAYLCDERGDFVRVDEPDPDTETPVGAGDDADGDEDGGEEDDQDDDPDETAGYLRDEPHAVQIDEGVCPWCPPDDRYEGDAVGKHASAAHPDEWADYKED